MNTFYFNAKLEQSHKNTSFRESFPCSAPGPFLALVIAVTPIMDS